jgi:transcriptional regulator with XRE-family HTH domain
MTGKTFYLKIKGYREKKKYTQEYVAIQMEISLKEYEKIENGEVDLKLSKLDKLSKILGVKKSEFFKPDF